MKKERVYRLKEFSITLYLYGRTSEKETSLSNYVYQHIHKLTKEERNKAAYQVCYALVRACNTYDDLSDVLKEQELKFYDEGTMKLGFVVINEDLISFLSLMKCNPYFIFFPEPPKGYVSAFASNEQYRDFFAFLSRENNLEILIELYHFSFMKGCTAECIAEKTKIDVQKVKAVLQEMAKRSWIEVLQIETGCSTSDISVYVPCQISVFAPFMILAEELMNPGQAGYALIDREDPILHHKQQENDKSKK